MPEIFLEKIEDKNIEIYLNKYSKISITVFIFTDFQLNEYAEK